MEDAVTIFKNRSAIARCAVYDLERERTRQAFELREMQRDRRDTTVAFKRLAEIESRLKIVRASVVDVEATGITPIAARRPPKPA